jgi:hypothetical protein
LYIRSHIFSNLEEHIETIFSNNTTLAMMENEYVFNYDEVKRRFESVPSTNSIAKKFKSTTYKTRFQPRTKSVIGKNEGRSMVYPLVPDETPRQERLPTPTVTFQVHVIRVQQVMPMEQIHQGFYMMPNLIK